ncbi:hypothetical protein AVEN_197844-1 [Araneus ventricosus]|uniref:Uncharacterized protein n=1 Tax=Araneus ventricosus TaxID=182803 RepID=A0A4Y2QJE0_ARAVE|nr:hypothetical protein AVEN_197844-1 [Araneus ventricosus]
MIVSVWKVCTFKTRCYHMGQITILKYGQKKRRTPERCKYFPSRTFSFLTSSINVTFRRLEHESSLLSVVTETQNLWVFRRRDSQRLQCLLSLLKKS